MYQTIQIIGFAMGMASLSSSLPTAPQLTERAARLVALSERQMMSPPMNLSDTDILQFALTAENLETAFYSQGFSMFKDEDFANAGLSPDQIKNLHDVGTTEATHVTTLSSAISSSGEKPVQPCQYKFGFTDAKSMIQTAAVLENVGVSAYLGAAPLIKSPAILGAAAQIVTVESRHQTFIRTASNQTAIPSAFDTPLGVRSVFTLVAPFIVSCPKGSNLNVQPFPMITMGEMMGNSTIIAGQSLSVSGGNGATACAFTNGGLPGGSAFVDLKDGKCAVPSNLAGVTYLSLTNNKPSDNMITDEITVAGPMVLIAS